MKKRSMISTKDHYIIIDDMTGIGDELSSGTELEGVANGVKAEISYIGFLVEGGIQIFDGTESNWQKKYDKIVAPLLTTSIVYDLGSCSIENHTIQYSIWPKWGEEGKRINLGMYLAGVEDSAAISKTPTAGRILSETCTRNVYRDLEDFEYVSVNKYNE
jgi:hypothetical protein